MTTGSKGGTLGRRPDPERRQAERLVILLDSATMKAFRSILQKDEKPAVLGRELIKAEIARRQALGIKHDQPASAGGSESSTGAEPPSEPTDAAAEIAARSSQASATRRTRAEERPNRLDKASIGKRLHKR